MPNEPKKVIAIALDDYINALEYRISNELLGKIRDELKRDIPNMLKDEKKRVEYDPKNNLHHAVIVDPIHPIVVTHIESVEI